MHGILQEKLAQLQFMESATRSFLTHCEPEAIEELEQLVAIRETCMARVDVLDAEVKTAPVDESAEVILHQINQVVGEIMVLDGVLLDKLAEARDRLAMEMKELAQGKQGVNAYKSVGQYEGIFLDDKK